MKPDIETLVRRAESLGATFRVSGNRVKVSAPEPLPADLMAELKARKAAVLSHLVLPEEFHPAVHWATWLAEHILEDQATVKFNEAPSREVALRLSDVGRYLSEVLGRLSLMRSWEGWGGEEMEPGRRFERMRELCCGLEALRKALKPLGLAEIQEDPTA